MLLEAGSSSSIMSKICSCKIFLSETNRLLHREMPRLSVASQYLTDNFFENIISDFKKAGIKVEEENRIEGILFFKTVDQQNVLQVIFLDNNIQQIVTKYLAQLGGELRRELTNANSHTHSTVIKKSEYNQLSPTMKQKVASGYQYSTIKVKLLGLLALTDNDKICIGLEVEENKLRLEFGLWPQENPHITTTFMWRRNYEAVMKPVIGSSLGRVDKYAGNWSEVGGCRMWIANKEGGGEDSAEVRRFGSRVFHRGAGH